MLQMLTRMELETLLRMEEAKSDALAKENERLHKFAVQVANRVYLAYEVLANLAEKREESSQELAECPICDGMAFDVEKPLRCPACFGKRREPEYA